MTIHRTPALSISDVARAIPQIVMTGQKGVNNAVSDEFIDDQELSDASNFLIDYENAGVLIKREGITKEHSTDINSSITSIFDGINGDYVTANSCIWSLAGAELHSGLTAMTDPSWTTYTDGAGNTFDIISDNTKKPLKTSDGTTFSTINSAVSCLSIEAFNNFLFGISGNTLRWSDFGDEDVWDASNSLTFDFQPTALKRYRNYLYMFNVDEFFQIDATTETNVSIVGRNYDEGCTSHRSVVVSPYGMFWWSKNGLIQSDGNQVVNISKRKIPITVDGLNRNKYSLVHGIWNPIKERVEFWLADGSTDTANLKIMYYPIQDAFFLCRGAGVEMGASGVVMESGVANVYVGSASSSSCYVYEQVGDTDDGIPIASYLVYKRVAPGGANAIKRMRTMMPMVFVVGDLTLTYSIYLNEALFPTKTWTINAAATQGLVLGSGVLGTDVLGTGTEPQEFPITKAFRYRKLKARIGDDTSFRSRIRGVTLDANIIRA